MRVENITFSISQSDMDFVADLLIKKKNLRSPVKAILTGEGNSCGRSKNFAIELAMF